MQARTPGRSALVQNITWFMGALVLAILVWIIATAQLNPVEEWRLREAIPIRVEVDDGLVITNQGQYDSTATVLVRGQQSVRELLTSDDLLITADLGGLGPGQHTVTLDWQSARSDVRIVDISPRQVTVMLEEIASKLVEVRANISEDPPFGYHVVGDPEFDPGQVTVTGPASRVETVAAVQVPLDLSRERSPVEDFARPIPVDADGATVTNVTVDTQIIGVSVDIQPGQPE